MHRASQRRRTRARPGQIQESRGKRSGHAGAGKAEGEDGGGEEIVILNTLFQRGAKVLIGVIHLRPLPGSPRWEGRLDSVIRSALNDARAYERGGAHALFIENFGDVPFTKGRV